MGKARVVSGGTDGLYTVRIERDLARVRRRIEALTLERARLSEQIAQQLQVRAAAADALLLATGAATDAWSALPTGDADGYQAAMQAAAEAQMEAQQAEAVLAIADSDLGLLRLRDQAAESDIQRLQAIPEYVQIPAWCADLTETLAPDTPVGLMIPGDERAPGVSPVIRPGYGGAAAYSAERDGQLQPVAASTPAQTALNLVRLPFRQRWKPRVRTAVITAISGDTCSLLLDDQRSTQQNLPTIPHTGDTSAGEAGAPVTLPEVPIQYMSCNGAAFVIGDRVMVAFAAQDFNSPKVVGFYSNPRPCNVSAIAVRARYAIVRCTATTDSYSALTGGTGTMSGTGQFTAQTVGGEAALIEYQASGSASIEIDSGRKGGTRSISYELTVWATIRGVRRQIYHEEVDKLLTYRTDTGTLTSAVTTLSADLIAPTYICESGANEYWSEHIEKTITTTLAQVDAEDPASLSKSDAAEITIGCTLQHSSGITYGSGTITRSASSLVGADGSYIPAASEIVFGTTNPSGDGFSPLILPPELLTIPMPLLLDTVVPNACGTPRASVNAQIISATGSAGLPASRRRTGAVSGDAYTLQETAYFGGGVTGTDGYIDLSHLPTSLSADEWLESGYLSDPDDVVSYP